MIYILLEQRSMYGIELNINLTVDIIVPIVSHCSIPFLYALYTKSSIYLDLICNRGWIKLSTYKLIYSRMN